MHPDGELSWAERRSSAAPKVNGNRARGSAPWQQPGPGGSFPSAGVASEDAGVPDAPFARGKRLRDGSAPFHADLSEPETLLSGSARSFSGGVSQPFEQPFSQMLGQLPSQLVPPFSPPRRPSHAEDPQPPTGWESSEFPRPDTAAAGPESEPGVEREAGSDHVMDSPPRDTFPAEEPAFEPEAATPSHSAASSGVSTPLVSLRCPLLCTF